MRLTLTLSILFFQCCAFLSAQSFSWAHQFSGMNFSSVEAITTDAQGNVYSTGYFSDVVDFDPGPGVTSLTSTGGYDIFVTKMDSVGNLIWAVSMGGAASTESGNGIAVDASGNVYVTGDFNGVCDFNPGAGVDNMTSVGGYDVFVVKLSSGGQFFWAKRLGGGSVEHSNAIGVDINGHVYTTGFFSGQIDWDPNSAVVSTSALGPRDSFVWKLNSAGGLLWGKNFGGPNCIGQGTDLELDPAGVVMVIGQFTNTCDFDPSAAVSNRTSSGAYEGYLCALDIGGNYLNALTFGGTGNDYLEDLQFEADGTMYIAGFFENTADFDPGPGVYNLTSAGWQDAVIIKLNPFGSFAWARSFGNTGVDYGMCVDVDAAGNVYVGGKFDLTVDFDPGAGVSNLTSAGVYDAFVNILDSAGNYLEAFRIGGAGVDEMLCLHLDITDVLILGGKFQDGADLNPYNGTHNVYTDDQDGFIVRLGACINTVATIVETACGSYSAPDGNVYTTAGTYTATIPNVAGCDSVITINLVNVSPPIDLTVSNNAPVLYAQQSGAIYQWIDCSNNNAPIPGANGQFYFVTMNGSYAVIITLNNCTDTSSCINVFNTGIEFNASASNFAIYPNPAQDFIKVSLPAQSIVRITDVTGRVLSTETIPQDGMLSVQHLEIGTYFVTEVKTGRTLKLMKQ